MEALDHLELSIVMTIEHDRSRSDTIKHCESQELL
jgi:hypothetical protein